LTKAEYYTILASTQIQLNTSQQDWISFTLLEALTCGCKPLYPNHRSFPDTLGYHQPCLYVPGSIESMEKHIDYLKYHSIAELEIGEENLMGTRLPILQSLSFRVSPYGLLTKPFWVDALVAVLQQAMEQSIRIQVARRRVDALEQAERIVTQRYNLFDKVLIPRAKQNIRKISIYLADAERAGVVNSKIAKRKKEHQVP
jgi:hypothetical protein